MAKEWTYKKAGVDREKEEDAVSKVWELISQTFTYRNGKIGQPLNVKGHYAGLLDIGCEKSLALHVDGVGTKVLVAQRMNTFDTVGIDLVAMHANDLLCVGAEPVALTDYLALEHPKENLMEEIMKGIVQGAKKSSMIVLGGESATLPEIVKGVPDSGFDLAGMSLGIVDEDKIITGNSIKEGDLIFGLESNGIHSNGLTLARKLFFDVENMEVDDPLGGTSKSVGEALLKPTKIYTSEVMEILETCSEIHGIAHITGGGYTKLHRIRKEHLSFSLHMPKPQQIFLRLKEIGNISPREMYNTFNMGIGLVIVATSEEKKCIENICKKHGTRCYTLGEVKQGRGIHVKTWNDDSLTF